MTTPSNAFEFSLTAPIHERWESARLLGVAVENWLMAAFHDVDESKAIAMVTGELLENAFKYGAWERPGADANLGLRVASRAGLTTVVVENPIERDESLSRLYEIIEWLASYRSPGDAFRARMQQLALADEPGTSTLGLLQIAHAGNCALAVRRCGSDDSPRVRVTATLLSDDRNSTKGL